MSEQSCSHGPLAHNRRLSGARQQTFRPRATTLKLVVAWIPPSLQDSHLRLKVGFNDATLIRRFRQASERSREIRRLEKVSTRPCHPNRFRFLPWSQN